MRRAMVWFVWFVWFVVATALACSSRERQGDPVRETPSEEMLSEADRARLAKVSAYSPEAIGQVKELLASPDMFVRMMTLTRLERWPRERYLSFALGAAGLDQSSLVRAKALALAWRGVTNLDREDNFSDLVDATFARLTDPDDGVFELAVGKLAGIDDTGHLVKFVQVIPQAPPSRLPGLFTLFCKKDLTREEVAFVIEHESRLGAARAACQAQVARAHRHKYRYE